MTVKGCCCCLLKSFELLGHLILSLSVRYRRNPNRGFFFSPQEIKRKSCLPVTTLLMICIVTNFMRAGVYSYDQLWGWWLLFDFPHCHGRREQRNCCYTLNLGNGDRTIFVEFVPVLFILQLRHSWDGTSLTSEKCNSVLGLDQRCGCLQGLKLQLDFFFQV